MNAKSSIKPYNLLKIEISQLLQTIIIAAANELNKNIPTSKELYSYLGPCLKPELGQFTLTCFQLAKSWQMTPPAMAQLIQSLIQSKLSTKGLIKTSTATGPYLNFQLELKAVFSLLNQQIDSGNFFKPTYYEHHEKIMVEYSQPNTHKEMHVGHMRNVCLGSAIVNLYKYLGHEVISCTYPGDMGTHVAKCLWYYQKNTLTPPTSRKGAWLGSIYSKAHLELEAQRGTEAEEKNRLELTAILQEMHSGKGTYYDLWKETRKWSLELMEDVYSWIHVKFDHWFFESEVDQKSLQLVDDFYKKGIFVKDEGAIGIDLSNDGLGFCLLLKSDGNGLYATKDLELARLKFEQFKITKNVYVVDVRQSLHFKQVFKTLEKMGFEQAKQSHHLSYEMVELPDGAMSSRKGNIIPIQTLIDEMELTIKNQYLNKYINEWTKDEIELCAHRIANAAIKYGMLKIDPIKKIVFDLAEWLKIDGNSGPYLLYSYARAGAILQKAHFSVNSSLSINNTHFTENAETDLLMKMCSFNEAALEAAEKNSPNILCNYLYELCQQLNTFYAQCNIMNAPDANSKNTRLFLLHNFRNILKCGLHLLNIEYVEKM